MPVGRVESHTQYMEDLRDDIVRVCYYGPKQGELTQCRPRVTGL
jgi:hypothetical protein